MNPPVETTSADIGYYIHRRNFVTLGLAAAVGGLAFTAPACPSTRTKEKAVKYVGLVRDLTKEAVPLLGLLGAPQIAAIFNDKVIPGLDKLKDVLGDVNIPESRSTLETVRAALGAVQTALLQLPESARRTTIIGILATARIFLLTIEAFVDSEMSTVTANATLSTDRRSSMANSINKALEATRP